jgi:hypothetical protein
MKKITNPGLSIFILLILALAACKKTDTPEVIKSIDNTPPVANAGKDTTIIFPVNIIVLDGSGSTDKENNITYYAWREISGSLNNNAIQQQNSAKIVVMGLGNRIYQFELTVTDQWSASSKDTIQVSLIVEPPTPGNTKASDDITLHLPYNRTYLHTYFKVNYPDSFSVIINWEKISGPNSLVFPDPTTRSLYLENLAEGVYQFAMTVTYWNQLIEKDTVTVTVLPDNNTYTTEKLLERSVWTNNYPFSSTYSISINDISSIIPAGKPFLVYLKYSANADWEPVAPDPGYFYFYNFSISNNTMTVFFNYGYDPMWSDDSDLESDSIIKIVY